LRALLHSLNLVLQRLLEWAVIAVVGVLFAGVLWGVITRFVFPFPSLWTEELARLLLIWVTFLGVAAVFLHGGVVLVSDTLAAGQLTPALQVRMGWVYLVVPVSGAAIVCFAVERMLQIADRRRHDESTQL